MIESVRKKNKSLMHQFVDNQFIDYDKILKHFHINLYLTEYKIVIKTPLVNSYGIHVHEDSLIEKFDLTKYLYILSIS